MKHSIALVVTGLFAASVQAVEPISIGSHRELFVDRTLVGELRNATLKLHEPRLAEPLIKDARPHGHYATVLKADDKFQFYYRGDKDPQVTWKTHGIEAYHDGEVTLYAESKDGLHWSLPKLGLFEHPSFPAGNIVLMNEFLVNHNFTPFIDTKPGVPPDQKYKALGGIAFQPHQSATRDKRGPGGLKAFVSPDGIHWKKLRDEPVVPEDWGKYFDSQNYAFWSDSEQCYVCFFRRFIKGMRGIARTTSQDFINWTPLVEMQANLPNEHLYTPCTQPYFRAPQIYIAMPTRFMDKRGAATDVLLMTTRGGNAYDRAFTQSFIRPGLSKDGWANRANYAAIGIHQTSDTEMSMFLTGGRRYTLRLDGFASVNAPLAGGEFVTKPLTFSGKKMEINYATSAAGQLRVELQDADGKSVPGFSLDDCEPIWGDHIARIVKWKSGDDVSMLAGKPVRLRFELSDADLFAIQFVGQGTPAQERTRRERSEMTRFLIGLPTTRSGPLQMSLPTCFRNIAFNLCLALVAVHGETNAFGQQTFGSLQADRILFLGNSLTLHGPKAEIGWAGNWGMAASAQEKDYVHLLTAAIAARSGGRLVLEPTPVDGTKSAENVLNIANILEREYATYEAAKIRKQLDWKANVVVLQCGENVPPKGFDAKAFHKSLQALLDDLKASSNPQIFVTGNILWGNPGLDEIKRKVCDEDPGHRTFVDISAYQFNIPINGPVGHPSDVGMKLIADTLFVAISKKADSVELSAAHLAAVNRRRRIYVNNDVGYDAVAMGPKLTAIKPEEWLAARFSAFDQPGSQVDCVGWCLDEGNIAAYPSKVLPELQYPTLLRWRAEGVDIAKRIVEASHQRKLEVFWEHRLNGADREADVNTPARHPLKDQHPEWLIAGSWWNPGLWNFAIPEVRQYKVAALREVAERYDLDGINLDFGRHPPFLPTGQQWEHREALTEFIRQVRLMLQGVAERRGRPFLLSVRVADTVPGCHFDGLDVETWVRHNLVDMIIIGTRSIQVDLPGFKRITTGSHVKLYPCIDQHHSPDGYHAVPSPEFLRGVAANWWHQGADGIATFNFWNELPDSGKVIGSSGPLFNGQSVHALAYTELGDPKQLASLNKWFVVDRRYGGGFYDRLGNRWNDYTNLNHQAPLPLKLGADPTWVEVSLADDIAARANQVDRLELRLQLSADTAPEQIAVKFNGITLRPQKQEGNWWVSALTPQQTATGRNLITLDGAKPGGREQAISLEKVEVHVKYRPNKLED